MTFNIESTQEWSDIFFERFVSLFQGELPPQSFHELKDLWGNGKYFSSTHQWTAWILYSSAQKPLARALISNPKENPKFLSLGYYESLHHEGGVALLREIISSSKTKNLDIRGPINGSFFHQYRMKVAGNTEPFFTESNLTPSYMEDFTAAGFRISGHWKSLEIQGDAALGLYDPLWRRVQKKWVDSETQIRKLDLASWETELKNLFALIHQTFSEMPNFEPLEWPTFRHLFFPLKHILNPRLILFAERKGKIEGFAVGLLDPNPILQKNRKLSYRLPGFKFIWNLVSFWELKILRPKTKLLVLYIGKSKESKAPWLGIAMGREITKIGLSLGFSKAIICNVADKSPIYTTLPTNLNCVSKYILFEKRSHDF